MCLSFCAARCLLCGAGLAQLGREFVQVLLRLFLTVEECSEEVCLRGRQGLRPYGHGRDVYLESSVFFMGVLDGAAVNRLGFPSIQAFLLAEAPRLFLAFCRSRA